MKKILKSERGQSLVEMAVSLVVLLWLLAGAVEFGLAYFQFIQLRDAAQEGALYGSINPPVSSGDAYYNAIVNRIKQQSNSPINLGTDPGFGYEITWTGNGCITDSITVKTTYQHKIFMPFANLFTGGNNIITIRASVTDTILSTHNSTC